MTKVDIRRLDSVTTNDTTATQLINENFEALQEAIENTISRDGTTPNFMDADLDLNSYKIINAGTPTNNTDVITKEYFDEYVGDAPGYASAAEQAANRASTAAQAAQGYSSVASGAADVSQRARDFIESDPGFVVVSTDLLLGDNSEIHKVNANKTNIDTVAGSISNVNTVSTDIANVNAVAGDLTNIDNVVTNMTDINNVADDLTKIVAVANDLTKIDNVADDLTNIDNVADDLINIDAVANNIANVNAVANNETNINAVNANKTNIDTVATNIADVNSVSGDITKVTAVADDLTNIDAVNANKTNIDAVAGNNSNITAVAGNAANINAVNANKTNIDAVVANATNINTVAGDIANINAVAADLTNIDAASEYAASSKQYAVGLPTEPAEGSAKYWAAQAAAGQVQADWAEADTSSIAYIKNKPTVDASPTQNSTNLVQSGGVFTATNSLQSQIDAIVASSDVYDIVADYAALQAYDITTVPVNDIIKVLIDSTHDDAATYYRCVESGGVKSWSYIGAEGAYYTKAETNSLLGAKQNTITGAATSIASSDLTASKALVSDANGKVAVSSVTSTELGYVSGVTSAIQTQLGNKANDSDVVKLTGNQTVAGEKTFTSKISVSNETGVVQNISGYTNGTTPSTNYYPNTMILNDSAGNYFGFYGPEMLTDGSYSVRMGVKSQVDNTKYSILKVGCLSDGTFYTSAPTPATSDNSTKIATTAFVINVLETIYPVGSCYIGTTSNCPLASLFGTWTLKSSGIVTSVDTSVQVKGNGIALGLTNGTNNGVMSSSYSQTQIYHSDAFGVNVGATANHSVWTPDLKAVGVTTDASKSGIVGTVTRTTLSVNIWERTA